MKTIYTKDNCPACNTLKDRLKSLQEPFKEINIGRDITREDFMAKYPTVRTVPYVVENNNAS